MKIYTYLVNNHKHKYQTTLCHVPSVVEILQEKHHTKDIIILEIK